MSLFYRKTFLILLFFSILFPFQSLKAQVDSDVFIPPENEYFKAKVTEIISRTGDESLPTFQQFKATALEGTFKGKEITITQEAIHGIYQIKKVQKGETLVIFRNILSEPEFTVEDKYRIPALWWLLALFLGCVFLFTGKKGFRATLSLLGSLIVIVFFMVPQIARGANPLLISLLSALFLLLLSIYLGHGVNKRSTIALISSLSVIGLSVILGEFFIYFGKLFGLGSDEAVLLQFGNLGNINLRGLLLAGIIIGTIGVLDDVTVVQAATVEEIHSLDPNIKRDVLYKKGMSVGKEHILSMVNTLILAYTGAALPLVLFFTFQEHIHQPFWVKMNSESISEEVVRSLIGSIVLIFAVPLTTWIAAYSYNKSNTNKMYDERNKNI
jgi:uncharacterized membrane protein